MELDERQARALAHQVEPLLDGTDETWSLVTRCLQQLLSEALLGLESVTAERLGAQQERVRTLREVLALPADIHSQCKQLMGDT